MYLGIRNINVLILSALYSTGERSILDVQSSREADCDTDIVWWLQKLGEDWQEVNKQQRNFIAKDRI